LDARGAPWLTSRAKLITFSDVSACDGLGDSQDQYWIHDEVYTGVGGGCELRVLLSRTELHVTFRDLSVEDAAAS
jgi:hypothetical protein